MTEVSAVLATWPLDNVIEIAGELLEPRPLYDVNKTVGGDQQVTRTDQEFFRISPILVPAETVEFLRSKGALTVPPLEFRNKLLEAYAKWIHPQLPVLDLPNFLREVILAPDSGFSSPLLYQPVMFAGSAFVELQHLHAAGYSSRLEARKSLFDKARVCVVPSIVELR